MLPVLRVSATVSEAGSASLVAGSTSTLAGCSAGVVVVVACAAGAVDRRLNSALTSAVEQVRTCPRSTSSTWSARLAYCTWCVTSTTVLPARRRPSTTTRCSSCAPTTASTAANGSSSRYTARSWYSARARASRARCPPLKLMPLPPISVRSPSGIAATSGPSAHASSTASRRVRSSGRPKSTLSRSVPLTIHGSCVTYATEPSCSPSTQATEPSISSRSPSIARSSAVLPAPTAPTTTVSVLWRTASETSLRTRSSSASPHDQLARSKRSSASGSSSGGRLNTERSRSGSPRNASTRPSDTSASTTPLMTHGKALSGVMSMLNSDRHVNTVADESALPLSV
eukprot:Unigene17459_Nuclearia_a/m.51067 Unigene17459_Nuclearia_a/g.51067  ORF Unigene17459_Nuclearia_a/g.51067 Unigene17459_Nuclearia_a/m.51067 type:complete len:342 (+) Unigene17459_Nuclearia_a:351-1376(+)